MRSFSPRVTASASGDIVMVGNPISAKGGSCVEALSTAIQCHDPCATTAVLASDNGCVTLTLTTTKYLNAKEREQEKEAADVSLDLTEHWLPPELTRRILPIRVHELRERPLVARRMMESCRVRLKHRRWRERRATA